jgi:hypothetical protein
MNTVQKLEIVHVHNAFMWVASQALQMSVMSLPLYLPGKHEAHTCIQNMYYMRENVHLFV